MRSFRSLLAASAVLLAAGVGGGTASAGAPLPPDPTGLIGQIELPQERCVGARTLCVGRVDGGYHTVYVETCAATEPCFRQHVYLF